MPPLTIHTQTGRLRGCCLGVAASLEGALMASDSWDDPKEQAKFLSKRVKSAIEMLRQSAEEANDVT